MITPHQAKYFAYQLTKESSSTSIEKFVRTLSDAQVDLNPHQIDAALFAFRSPLSKGAILADEVGLGKTIEAGILLAQKWAERKRRLLVIAPATLRKQWNQELSDKFFIPSMVLEKKTFDQEVKKGNFNPFEQDCVILCSYQFVRSKDIYVQKIPWDLVIIDEAHRLRNVYKSSNKIGKAIKAALYHSPKILLTATPLQNSIQELYGLVSIIDDYIFGDLKSFKDQFGSLQTEEDYKALKNRIKPICQRTLRRQVLEYVSYTNRIPITQEFFPTKEEQRLYDLVSDYLQKEKLFALPSGQRKLVTLILRKLLASSTFAISGTIDALYKRLEDLKNSQISLQDPIEMEVVAPDFEATEELEEEWDEEEESEKISTTPQLSNEEKFELEEEMTTVREFQTLAHTISKNSKGEKLQTALKKGFEKLKELGATEKAVIFTESTRTQQYLFKILESTSYQGKVILFNGSNSDPKSKEIYKSWLSKHQGTDKITGSPTSDMRAALVEYFKNEAVIMIATEAAAEGINLQFCSLVVNYDLPWNPQRIEQRIGRCHRYGQKHDVVVVNFLNKANAADQRVYELLSEKFKLFDGVFGASDEVLGTLESGLDFEKKIHEIVQKCRSPQQIEMEFNTLQSELEENIRGRLTDTKRILFENFDEEVQEKLRVGKLMAEEALSRHEAWLWQLTRFYLRDYAEFDGENNSFVLKINPFPNEVIHPGPYKSGKNIQDANLYRVGHSLAQKVIEACKQLDTQSGHINFQLSQSGRKLTALEPFVGKSGFLSVYHYQISSLENEDYIIASSFSQDGTPMDEDMISKLMTLPAGLKGVKEFEIPGKIGEQIEKKIGTIKTEIDQRNAIFFDQEIEKLDLWAEDRRNSQKALLKQLDDEKKEFKKYFRQASNMPERLELQKKIRAIEKKRDEAWKEYDESAKQVDFQKDQLLDQLEKKLEQTTQLTNFYSIQWSIT